MSMTFGNQFKVTLFGSAHSEAVGVTISGLPSGIFIDEIALQRFVYRRSSRSNVGSTPRRENDIVEFEKGLVNGVTTGEEIKAIIKNKNANSKDYDKFDALPRPSHADYVSHIKYGKAMEGGGIFSGRMTAPLCVAGGIAMQILKEKEIEIFAYISQLGRVKSKSFRDNLSIAPEYPNYGLLPLLGGEVERDMIEEIDAAQAAGDSLGGIIECVGLHLPVGVGEPFFRSLESRISAALFSVPAVKGVDFGRGFDFGSSKGSEVSDSFNIVDDKIITKTNNNGGINGGLSNGMPLLLRVAVKPTSSITIEQDTVNLKTKQNDKIKIEGRHDVTIVPRAVPCIESAVAIAILDLMCEGKFIEPENTVTAIRTEVDRVDDKIAALLVERQNLTRKVGVVKREKDLNVFDEKREQYVLDRVSNHASGILREHIENIYNAIFQMSRNSQKSVVRKERCERVYLVGKSLKHSISTDIHKLLGHYSYENKEIKEEDFKTFLDERQFDALNVTIPYKRMAANLVQQLDEIARRTGVVNTILCINDSLKGFNTDYFGFKYLINKYKIKVENKKIVILGQHGTAMTVKCVLEDMHAGDIISIAREDLSLAHKMKNIKDADIIINATPIGMWPDLDECPIDLDIFTSPECVIDVNYNPYRTKLLINAKARKIQCYNGLLMLIAQAKASAELFSNEKISDSIIDGIFEEIVPKLQNIVLIGMGGCGKTTVGKELGVLYNCEVLEIDEIIVGQTGKSILQIFDEEMEEGFRRYETGAILEASLLKDVVISTGGGAVLESINTDRLRANGILVYIKSNPDTIEISNRPCYATRESAKRVYAKRTKMYDAASDIVVENHIFKKTTKEIVEEIKNALASCKWS